MASFAAPKQADGCALDPGFRLQGPHEGLSEAPSAWSSVLATARNRIDPFWPDRDAVVNQLCELCASGHDRHTDARLRCVGEAPNASVRKFLRVPCVIYPPFSAN